jgi:uncharacterized membrane protein
LEVGYAGKFLIQWRNEEAKVVKVSQRMEEFNKTKRLGPFRRAVLRGLGILLPPLLTIVIFLWIAHTISEYLLTPLANMARSVAVEEFADIRSPSEPENRTDVVDAVVVDGEQYPLSSKGTITIGEKVYHRTVDDDKFVPLQVYDAVRVGVGRDPMPTTAKDIYRWYVDHRWLPQRFLVPIFLCLFLLGLYLLGKFLAAGVGRFFWNQFERLIHRVPLVSNVYSSIKQVTDFLFSEPEMQYTRVVAIEYPRRGIWTLGFITGEAMHDIQVSVDEPVVSAFVPHSPMPFTGFAVTVKKSETVDLNISVDQAIQFVISCGVVIPPVPGSGAPLEGVTPHGERLQLSATADRNG